ncbi:Dabb family protein [Agriterribacter sp.]|uniref:Dabb family protein n=1 Tax=Agriterribacter sp. TaxID=2821509 RepID=UPI002B5A7B40|nr:Dabb family protein [Agriterribacter sp.]HRO44527.1 Dabb family protein [Agriterribacter sp.]HRQ16447.1 Dabb family protein [Agriterribacter sp.]
MHKISRRKFVHQTTKTAIATVITAGAIVNTQAMSDNNTFIHHVYFWLNNPDSKTDFEQLVAGLRKLSAVKTIKTFYIGKPANTSRDVIDSSYSVSWLLLFNNKADQDSYQTDPIHLKFVEECKHLWKKVVVYDTVNV